MPMIDSDLIKPASDAVQAAIKTMRDITTDKRLEEMAGTLDAEKNRRYEEAKGAARNVYERALMTLSDKVDKAIKQVSA